VWYLRRTMAKAGRKPAGRDEKGRPVPVSTSYVQTTLRLPVDTKAILDAVAALEGRSQSAVMEAALRAYVAALPSAGRQVVEAVRVSRLAASKKR